MIKRGVGSLHTFFLTFTFSGFDSDLLVIFLEGGEIFSGFRELSFFHTLTNVPMDEGSLGVHEIEFVIDSGEDLTMAVELEIMQTALMTLARSPPGTTVGG